MTAAELNTLINYKARTDDVTFTPADKLILVNIFKDEMAARIVELNNGMFLIPQTFDLVADQRQYYLGDDLLARIQKVEIKFVATNSRFPSRYVKDYMLSETESEIVATYGNGKGEFAHTIRRRALFILSGTIIAVTNGIRVWAHIFPADLANLTDNTDALETDPTTTSFGFPRQLQELLARRVVIEYKGRQPKPIPLSPMERNYENDLKIQLDALAHVDNSGEIIADLPPAADMYDNGWAV